MDQATRACLAWAFAAGYTVVGTQGALIDELAAVAVAYGVDEFSVGVTSDYAALVIVFMSVFVIGGVRFCNMYLNERCRRTLADSPLVETTP